MRWRRPHAAQLEEALADDDAFAKIHEAARGQAKKVEAAEDAGDQTDLLGLQSDDRFVNAVHDVLRGVGRAQFVEFVDTAILDGNLLAGQMHERGNAAGSEREPLEAQRSVTRETVGADHQHAGGASVVKLAAAERANKNSENEQSGYAKKKEATRKFRVAAEVQRGEENDGSRKAGAENRAGAGALAKKLVHAGDFVVLSEESPHKTREQWHGKAGVGGKIRRPA